MAQLGHYVDMIKRSRLLAPNLREMTLQVFTGNAHPGNHTGRDIIRRHLLALRWMNPNAVVYLKEVKGQGQPSIAYRLWNGEQQIFEISPELSADEAIAKVLQAARDPDLDEGATAAATSNAAAAPSPSFPVSSPSSSAAPAADKPLR